MQLSRSGPIGQYGSKCCSKTAQREEVPHINLVFRPTLLLPACCLLIYILCLAKTHIGGTAIKSGWDPSCGWSLVSLAVMLRGLTQKASMRWRSRQMAGSKRVGTETLPDCTWQERHNAWWVPTRTLGKTKAGFLLRFSPSDTSLLPPLRTPVRPWTGFSV